MDILKYDLALKEFDIAESFCIGYAHREEHLSLKLNVFLDQLKCYLFLGDVASACDSYYKIQEINPHLERDSEKMKDLNRDLNLLIDYMQTIFNLEDDYDLLLRYTKKAEMIAPCSKFLKILKLECLIFRGMDDDIKEIYSFIASNYQSGDGGYIEGLLHYSVGSYEEAQTKFNNCLRLYAENEKIKIYINRINDMKNDDRNVLRAEGEEAFRVYSIGLNSEILNPKLKSTLYFNRGLALMKLDRFFEAFEDFTLTIKQDPLHSSVYMFRGRLYVQFHMYNEAIDDFTKCCSPQILDAGQKSIIESRNKENRSDFEILEVSSSSSIQEIKKAYHLKALQYHPDKHTNKTREMIKVYENKFKQVSAAFKEITEFRI